ncbi:MAG: MFS transporter [Solirubrobacterales bacterium]|nr:MFS transporter [Solirubrobacterales bacterium]
MSVKSRLPALVTRPGGRGVQPKRSRRSPRPPVPPGAWRRLWACTAAAALLQLDGTVITVALPSVAHSLRVSNGSTAIVLSAYFVAYALALLPAGSLVDRFDARRLALLGLGLFAIGAGAGAVAPSIGVLVATRIVQGIGAGLVSPAALAGAVSGFPPERRGGALGIWGASAGISNLLGPVLGGVLTVALGWRADWWALVPLALLAAAGILRFLPPTVHGEDTSHPVLNHTVVLASLVAGLTFAVMIGSFYLAEQYLQRAAGFSALGASAVLVVVALLVGVAAPIAGRLVDQYGERLPAVAGFLAAALGLLILGIPGVSLSSGATILPLIPIGLGLGMLFVPTSRAALNATPMASHGRTSALLSMGRLLGAAVGAGLAGICLAQGVTASNVHTALLIAAATCLFLGVPAASRLGTGIPQATLASGVEVAGGAAND